MKKYMALPLFVLLLLTVSASARYHGMKGWAWWDNDTIVKDLGVTPEQMTKIKEIDAKYKPAFDKTTATYEQKKDAYWKVKSDPQASKPDVIKAFDVMWDAKYKMMRVDLDRKLDAKAVLTPEQITKLDQIRTEHIKKMKEKWKEKKGKKEKMKKDY